MVALYAVCVATGGAAGDGCCCPAAVRPGDDEEAFPTSRVDSVFATVFAMAAESVRAAGLVCPATPCM